MIYTNYSAAGLSEGSLVGSSLSREPNIEVPRESPVIEEVLRS